MGRRRPGPVYDDSLRVLADDDLGAVLSLLGEPGPVRRLDASLTASTREADLVVAAADDAVVHTEYVKDPRPDLALTMVEYRVRLRRRHPDAPIRQYVLALTEAPVPTGYRDADRAGLRCDWTVVRVADLDPAVLLAHPTTAALAALARGSAVERAAVLRAAAAAIASGAGPERAAVLLGAAATLASIALPSRTIETALKEAAMPVPARETPLGREIYEEGVEAGRAELLADLLRVKFGPDPRIAGIAAALARDPGADGRRRIDAAQDLDQLG